MSKFSWPNKLKLANLPTPIQFMPWMSKQASKHRPVRVWMKRDDLNHGVAAGNKIRKLEYLLQEALSKKADTVFTCGAVQSNHARATAVLCKQLGLQCELFLVGSKNKDLQGNLLLNSLLDVKIHFIEADQLPNIPNLKTKAGKTPYFIPTGGSNETGTWGYINAFSEILTQVSNRDMPIGAEALPQKFDSIFVANGSGGTHAGLLLGSILHQKEEESPVFSINVIPDRTYLENQVKSISVQCIQKYRLPISFMPEDIRIIDGYVGEGYAKASKEIYSFLVDVSKHEGIFLDPVYTGKAVYGMIQELTKEDSGKKFGDNVLFVHTGGLPSIFAHAGQLTQAIDERSEK